MSDDTNTNKTIDIFDAEKRNPAVLDATTIIADGNEYLVSSLDATKAHDPIISLLAEMGGGFTETMTFRRVGDGELDFEEVASTRSFYASPADHQTVVDAVVKALHDGELV